MSVCVRVCVHVCAYMHTCMHVCVCVCVCVFVNTQAELERLQQSDARNATALHSLRQQLAEVEEGRRAMAGQRLPELHTEIGRLKSALKEKVHEEFSFYLL